MSDALQPRMPEVDARPDLESIFARARETARRETTPPGKQPGRHVVIVTPGRALMLQPCPRPGSMAEAQVASIEKLLSSKTSRNVAVIAYTELPGLVESHGRSIPFLGMLLGFAYIGHAVWVFEGHASALEAGCRDADILIVDGGMVPFLVDDWARIAASTMRRPNVFVHDREGFKLTKVTTAPRTKPDD